MRTSSCTCMKRFSKMFSVTRLTPSACVASAMYCACMSVGKPGYSSVEISAARKRAVGAHAHRIGPEHIDAHAGLLQLGDHRAQMRRVAVGHDQVAAGDGAGDQKRSRLDAVGIDAVARAVQAGHALHADGRRAGALDLRAHGGEQRGQVGDLRLARAVLHQRFALGQHRGHQQIFGAGDGDLVEDHVRAAAAAPRARFEVAVLLGDGRAHLFQALDVQIDGPAADGAAARAWPRAPCRCAPPADPAPASWRAWSSRSRTWPPDRRACGN